VPDLRRGSVHAGPPPPAVTCSATTRKPLVRVLSQQHSASSASRRTVFVQVVRLAPGVTQELQRLPASCELVFPGLERTDIGICTSNRRSFVKLRFRRDFRTLRLRSRFANWTALLPPLFLLVAYFRLAVRCTFRTLPSSSASFTSYDARSPRRSMTSASNFLYAPESTLTPDSADCYPSWPLPLPCSPLQHHRV